MKKLLTLLLLWAVVFGPSLLLAQSANDFDWKRVGPDNLGGRTRALAATNGGRIWAGATGGGLWHSENWGQTWTPADGFNRPQGATGNVCQAVSSIALDPSNPQVIYVGTGDWIFNYGIGKKEIQYLSANRRTINDYKGGHFDFVGQPGQGVFVSTDGGTTFSNLNATWSASWPTIDYQISQDNGQTVGNPWLSVSKVAVGSGGRVFAGTLRGVFYTDDRFQTVNAPTEAYSTDLPNGQTMAAADRLSEAVVLDVEVAGSNVFVATRNFVFISRDNGQSFTEVVGTDILPRDAFDPNSNPANKLRMEVAIAPSDPNVVYVGEVGGSGNGRIVGIWRSLDAGRTWVQVAPRSSAVVNAANNSFDPTRTIGSYTFTIAVHPENPRVIYLGSVQFWFYSDDEGWTNLTSSIEILPNWPAYIPANVHNILFYTGAGGQKMMFFASDREIVRSIATSEGEYISRRRGFTPATGLYYTSSAYGVAPTVTGELIAGTANAGIILKVNTETKSWRQLDRQLQSAGVVQGKVSASMFDPQHVIAGGQGFEIYRSLDDGETFERFYQQNLGEDESCMSRTEANPDPIRYHNRRGPVTRSGDTPSGEAAAEEESTIPSPTGYPITPFVLDEIYDLNDPYLTDTSGNPNPKVEQILFVASNNNIHLVKNVFASGNVLSSWFRLGDENSFFNPDKNNQLGISALAVSGDEQHNVYAGTADGRIFRITQAHKPCLIERDDADSIVASTRNPEHRVEEITRPGTPRRWITSLTVKPGSNPDTLIITYGGYANRVQVGGGMVYACFNAEAPVDQIQYFDQHDISLPFAPVYTAMFNPVDPNEWLAFGTEVGVYYCSPDDLTQDIDNSEVPFTEANQGEMTRIPVYGFGYMPVALETENPGTERARIKLVPNPTNDLYIATFGNGVLRSDLLHRGKNTSRNFRKAGELAATLFPNPAQQIATLSVELKESASMEVQLYGLDGRVARTYPAREFRPGRADFDLDLTGLTGGLYLVRSRVHTGGKVYEQGQKLMVN